MIKWQTALWVFLAQCAAGDLVLYDVTFSSPYHSVGSTPVSDTNTAPRLGPSAVSETTVVAEYGALTSQPAVMNRFGEMDFRLANIPGVSTAYPAYKVSMTLNITTSYQSTPDRLYVIFDTPYVRDLVFYSAGDWGIYKDGATTTFSTYTSNVPFTVTVTIDLANSLWTISQDSTEVYSGDFGATALQQMRIARQGNTGISLIAVDNVLVEAIPEPSVLLLLAFGSALLAAYYVPNHRLHRVREARSGRENHDKHESGHRAG